MAQTYSGWSQIDIWVWIGVIVYRTGNYLHWQNSLLIIHSRKINIRKTVWRKVVGVEMEKLLELVIRKQQTEMKCFHFWLWRLLSIFIEMDDELFGYLADWILVNVTFRPDFHTNNKLFFHSARNVWSGKKSTPSSVETEITLKKWHSSEKNRIAYSQPLHILLLWNRGMSAVYSSWQA